MCTVIVASLLVMLWQCCTRVSGMVMLRGMVVSRCVVYTKVLACVVVVVCRIVPDRFTPMTWS